MIIAAHAATAMPNFLILEHCRERPWFDQIQRQGVPLRGGYIEVEELARRPGLGIELDMEIVERRIRRSELYLADEVFLTGTAAEGTPIRELDHRTIGEGKRGPVAEKLQACFFDLVSGKLPQYESWLTYL